jgi:hypothetical protein
MRLKTMGTAAVLVALVAAKAALGCGSPESNDSQDDPTDTLSPEIEQCISTHPASEPFDVGDVTVASAASAGAAPASPAPADAAPASPAQMSDAVAPAPPTVDTFVAECRADGGNDCDESFISREAARCIAESLAFEPGLDAWNIAMTYHHSYHRVVWGVENLLEDLGDDGYSGKSLTLDAARGALLGRTTWRATP